MSAIDHLYLELIWNVNSTSSISKNILFMSSDDTEQGYTASAKLSNGNGRSSIMSECSY